MDCKRRGQRGVHCRCPQSLRRPHGLFYRVHWLLSRKAVGCRRGDRHATCGELERHRLHSGRRVSCPHSRRVLVDRSLLGALNHRGLYARGRAERVRVLGPGCAAVGSCAGRKVAVEACRARRGRRCLGPK
eukprot:Amastigsp_a6316_16.p4 type:complete len:131 gc:universal Amastigsp_a6316_16:958-566(-)